MSTISSTSSYGVAGSSSRGIPGMASGMDTEAMVEKMLSGTQSKIDKANAKKQVATWKQTMYRDVITKMNKFNSKYFDFLTSGNTNLTSNSFYNAMKSVSSSKSFNVSGSSAALVGNTKAFVKQLASASRLEGNAIASASSVSGKFDKAAFESNIAFSVKEYKRIEGADGAKSEIIKTGGDIVLTDSQIADLMAGNEVQIQREYTKTVTPLTDNPDKPEEPIRGTPVVTTETETITFKIDGEKDDAGKFINGTLKMDGGEQQIVVAKEAKDKDGNVIGKTTQLGLDRLGLKLDASSSASIDSSGKLTNTMSSKINPNAKATIDLSLDGIKKTITMSADMTNEDFQKELDFAFGKGALTLTGTTGGATDPLTSFEITTTQGRKLIVGGNKAGLESTGLRDGQSNTVAMGDTLENILGSAGFDADGKATFKINGKEIEISKTDTMSSLMKKINNSGADVEIKYMDYENRFVLSRASTGAGFNLEVEDPSGILKKTLGGVDFTNDASNAAYKSGTNAIVSVNGIETERSSNSFTISGLNFELLDVSEMNADGTYKADTITTTRNSEQIFDGIKAFVDDYNTLIKELNDLIDADSTYKDYAPLTDAQKKDMTKSEIDAWEKKAQEGLLKSDSEISSMLSQLRLSLYQKPETAKFGMYDIGIETGTEWKDRGKLILNEDKLKQMINSDPAAIQELFTYTKTKEVTNSKGEKETVDDGVQGIATAFKNIIKRTANTSSGSPGSLVEIAGVKGAATEKNNTISKQTTEMTERIKNLKRQYENEKARYWQQFNTMEKVLANLSSQSGWLTQQFGG